MSQYFVTDANGNIPHTYTVSLNPHLQSFHASDIINPSSMLYYQDRVEASFASQPLSLMDVTTIEAKPQEMKQPIVFDVKHSWRIFGSLLDSDEGLWMFDLSGRRPLELAKHRSIGMTFKSGWVADVKIDIEDAITCINFITMHPSFVPGTPLPHYFNTDLLSSILQSMEQARNLRTLAIIAMGELLAFINYWRITVGLNWPSNFSSIGCTFIRRIQLTRLPMWGANDEVGEILAAEDVLVLIPFLNDLRDSNPTLQPIKQLICGVTLMYIPPQSSVFLDIDGWGLIPVTCRLWLVMRWMYKAVMLLYLSQDGHHIVKFRYQHIFQWVEGSQAGKEAQNKQNSAQNNGILAEILSLAKRYASTHSPGMDLIDFTPGLKFPYTRVISPIQFGNKAAYMCKGAAPSAFSSDMMISSNNENSSLDLVYPFLDLSEDSSLPIPGPVVTSTLLPMDLPPTDTLTSKGARSPATDINSSTPSSPQCPSPPKSILLQRVSPYSRVANSEVLDNQETTSPFSWSSEILMQIDTSVESLISQV
ncbi:hypothetical protein ARMGADRAFT_1040867 [Armillaria gallica]|uniref:Uncharacterized protein n=1 Tax=Armillaria gallica TaxID=47427 RepID=A0A2H3C8H7_ARMGA|nr:hypothetical protein ARMGADRAFT_1040867 [Armillaria gallica]